MSEARFRPFSNGTEYMDWCSANCEQCVKRYDNAVGDWRCDLERAINEGAMLDGTIAREVAERIGIESQPFGRLGGCKERVAE